MTYLKVSRGFQGGNINGQATDPRLFEPFFPEALWAYVRSDSTWAAWAGP